MALLSEIGTVTTNRKTPKVNWLRDRIQPFYEIKMPDRIEEVVKANTVRVVCTGRTTSINTLVSLDYIKITHLNGKTEIIDNLDPRIKYVGTGWRTIAPAQAYGGNEHLTGIAGDYYEFTFTGSKFEIYGYRGSNRAIMEVFVNGELQGEFNLYNNGVIFSALNYEQDGLPTTYTRDIPGEWVSFPLGIFVLSTPTKEEINGMIYRDVEAYDGLIVLQENKISERVTAPVGQTYHSFILEMFEAAGVTKWNIEPSAKEITTALEWSIGTDYLKIINDLLAALNYTPLWTDENGFYISSLYRSPSEESTDITYKADQFSVIYNGMSEELDLFNVPNSWIMVLNDPEREPLVSHYQNDNPESPTSYQSRGRWIVDFREVTDIADQEALDAYTQRIAFAASQVYGKVEFETAAMPIHGYSDIIDIENEALGISGTYSETDWTISLDTGARMKHKVRRVINIDGEAVT